MTTSNFNDLVETLGERHVLLSLFQENTSVYDLSFEHIPNARNADVYRVFVGGLNGVDPWELAFNATLIEVRAIAAFIDKGGRMHTQEIPVFKSGRSPAASSEMMTTLFDYFHILESEQSV